MKRVLHNGFTLLELMVAVVILSILAAIAYPSYMNQVRETRRIDGKSAVLEVSMAEERYYTKNKAYTSTWSDLSINSTLKSGKSDKGYYKLTLTTSEDATTFTITATATGAQKDDTACATISMNQRGEKTSTGGGQCW